MNENGFLKLSRKFFLNEMWKAPRTFSDNEAWLDLIQAARFEVSPLTESIGGKEITYGRGQYPASNRFLAKRWGWGEQKVKTFLGKLKRKKMITTDCTQGMNVITLCNYNRYNTNNPEKNPASNTGKTLTESELEKQVTQLVKQMLTKGQPTANPNSKKEEKRKETSITTATTTSSSTDLPDRETVELFDNFRQWQYEACPNVTRMDKQLTAGEFERVIKLYTPLQLKTVIESMDNSKGKTGQPIYKRYVSVYRTFLNWAKNEYGENGKN